MAGVPEYANYPRGCGGPRCQHEYEPSERPRARRCGLPAWKGGGEEARCEFHHRAGAKLPDIRERLERAVRRGACLLEAKLVGADLTEAHLAGADLLRTDMRGCTLVGANLQEAHLAGAHLQGADLYKADLSGADLPNARLQTACLRYADLSAAQLRAVDLRGADLRFAQCRELARIKGRAKLESAPDVAPAQQRLRELLGSTPTGTRLEMAKLEGARLRGIILSAATGVDGTRYGARGGPQQHERRVRDEGEAHPRTRHGPGCRWCGARAQEEDQKAHPSYADCVAIYRQLRLAHETGGDYERASEFFVRERHCEWRAQKAQRNWRWMWGWFLEETCRFGEDPLRVAGWATGVLLVFAMVHGCLGISRGGHPAVGLAPHWPSPDGLCALWTALYFSAVTLTTLGYGDYEPATRWGQAAASVEAVLGILLMSLFMVCFARRFSR